MIEALDPPTPRFGARVAIDNLARDWQSRVFYAGLARGGIQVIVEKPGRSYVVEGDGFIVAVADEPIRKEMPVIGWPPGGDVIGEGDVLLRHYKGGLVKRYEVLGQTARGKLRLLGENGAETTEWWRTRADLPESYRVED